MKLSIVIPLYNKEKYIGRCLESLLVQDLPVKEYEIIVIDDGSKDSGGLFVQEYAEKHENIHFFKQKNAGPSAARNKGLDASKGDYIYFLDADDFLAANVLRKLIEIAEENNLEILEFNTKELKEESEFQDTISQNLHNSTVMVMDGISYIAEHDFRNEAWRYFVHKNLLAQTGIKFIEGTLYEDVIFTASLFLKAKRMGRVELDVHRYVTVADSIVTSKDAAHNLRFIHGMTFAVEKIHEMIKGLDTKHPYYLKAVKKLKARQQAFVFALIIRTFKYRLLNLKELKNVLDKMRKFEVYPIDPKIGGIGNDHPLYNKIFVPIFNNKTFLFSGMRVRRMIP